MTYTVEVDTDGKVAIPEPFREAYDLHPGSRLVFDDQGDPLSGGRIVLSPLEEYSGLRLVNGAWVVDDDRPVSVEDTLRQIEEGREERGHRILRIYP